MSTTKKAKKADLPAPKPGAKILTLDETANELRISASSMRRLVQSGALATVPLSPSGSMRGVLRTTLDAYLRSSETKTEQGEATAPSVRPSLGDAGWDGDDHLRPNNRRGGSRKV